MTTSTDQLIEAFARIAEEFCAWAEAPPQDPVTEARVARRLLLDLMRRAIALPSVFSDILDHEFSEQEYQQVYRRFGALPFNYYSECFDPLVIPPETPVVADLADDLADIWRDLKRGLLLWHEQSRNGAAWHWRFHFESHWGHHASAALYALQSWFAQHVDDIDA